jgi:hypothetical protein
VNNTVVVKERQRSQTRFTHCCYLNFIHAAKQKSHCHETLVYEHNSASCTEFNARQQREKWGGEGQG